MSILYPCEGGILSIAYENLDATTENSSLQREKQLDPEKVCYT